MKYEELLEKLYANLPEKVVAKERFEIPVFSSFVEGNQTIIKNLSEVAGVLRREPNHIIKFISKEFATPGNYDGKRGILQGKFKEDLLNKRLEAYVKEYVLCSECKKPDTSLIIFEGVKYKRCDVCGAKVPVKSL